ncbi:hypothetical protein HYE60_12100 [Aggregatibacter actinomycetemcomitans]|uniref:hypothetical protein n=1 Tax=Aggregatibacter actinomycetemcomitans TaxID=714 RepID=UPI00197CB322|nr:hypothetical protein [Aggregatibacter actinomycetemcomitans]MBN6075966.1 hypothetical protein [Aggregatibacter actinomycetemcomitans]
MMLFKKLTLGLSFTFLSSLAFAESWSMHISEDGVTTDKNAQQPNPARYAGPAQKQQFSFSDSGGQGKTTYINQNNGKKFDPKNAADVSELGKSIAFEVFEIKENKDSHSVFESGAGICYGFKYTDGVAFTDSTTYYVDKSKQQYYASIIGATVSSDVEPKNVQYAPVFNIQDPELDKEVKSEEQRNGKILINKNLQKSREILSNVVCK